MAKISGERPRQVEIPVPSIADQERLIERLDGLHDMATALLTDLTSFSAAELRPSILRKAFAGEL